MRKLSKIWIALLFVWFSKISLATCLLKLTTLDVNPVKKVGSNWKVECVGDRRVTWNYTNIDEERKKETLESGRDGIYSFSAVLSIVNVSYHDVETYRCHYADIIEDQDWSIINCTSENVTCAHLFVDDENHLLPTDEFHLVLPAYVGHPLVIPCRPTSPEVTVVLSRGAPVIPNARVSYSDTDGYTIDPVNAADNDYYTCKGTRGKKSQELFILVVTHDYIHEYPKINASLATAVKVGETFTLNCTIETAIVTPFTLKWSAPVSIIGTNRTILAQGHSKRVGSSSEITLHWRTVTVTNASKEDDPDYVCSLEIKNEKKNVNYTVEIFDEGEEFLNVTTVRNEIEVNASSTAKWVIEMYGFPRIASYEWRDRDNITIDKKRFQVKEQAKDKSVVLQIDPVLLEDAGIYFFVVKNQVGNTSILRLNLTVWDIPSVGIKPSRNGDFYHINENATFECVAKGYPHPDIEWLFNNCSNPFDTKLSSPIRNTCEHLKILQSSFDTLDTESGRRSVSKITANFEISGSLSCEASNSISLAYSSSPFLKIKLIDFVDDKQTGFTIVGSDVQTPIERSKTVIECAASRNDYNSSIRWYATLENSTEQLLDAKTDIKGVSISTQVYNTAWSFQNHLIIDEVTLKHTGNYRCQAADLHGNILNRVLHLKVQKLVAPVFNDRLTNLNNSEISFPAGDIIPRLRCSATGVPPPKLTWLRNGVPSNEWSSKFKKLLTLDINNRDFYFLQIPSQPEYNGNYTCRAQNDAKIVETFMNIEITDRVTDTIRPGWIVMIVFLSVIILVLLIYVGIKTYKDRKFRLYLIRKRSCDFRNGNTENINPELPISDQVNLLPYYDTWEFPKENLKLGIQLGSGAFGRVVKAEALGIMDTEPSTTVAVKMVKPNSDDSHINALVSELKIMVHLGQHVNVVNLLGACTKDLARKKELLVIVEYCRYGSLLSYLHRHKKEFVDQLDPVTGALDPSIKVPEDRYSQSAPSQKNRIAPNGYRFLEEITSPVGETERLGAVSYNPSDDYVLNSNVQSMCTDMSYVSNSVDGTDGRRRSSSGSATWTGHYRGDYQPIDVRPITTTDLLCWSFQIARGMDYLASRKVLHGDLAARNVLLADDNVVKICDFGLAKEMYQERYKKKSEGVLLPVKWMAIESICFGVFSTKSDVWSYGVVLWELFTLGKTPYPGMEADQRFYNMLTDGYRMEKPALAPSAIYDLMSDCWNYEPSNRPSFSSIVEIMGDLMEDDNLRAHFVDLNENYSRMNRLMMEGKEDYLIQMSGADFVFKEPSPEPERAYANVISEKPESNYLEPTKLSAGTKYENNDDGPTVQPLANNAGYIYMNTNDPREDTQNKRFGDSPMDAFIEDDAFGQTNVHNAVELDTDINCVNGHIHSGTEVVANSRSPLEEVQGVSNINYVPNNMFKPESSSDYAENQLYQRHNIVDSDHNSTDDSKGNKRKIDSGISSLESASEFKVPQTASSHNGFNRNDISLTDNHLYFRTDSHLSPILVNGKGHES